jgi:hypothetical protein
MAAWPDALGGSIRNGGVEASRASRGGVDRGRIVGGRERDDTFVGGHRAIEGEEKVVQSPGRRTGAPPDGLLRAPP